MAGNCLIPCAEPADSDSRERQIAVEHVLDKLVECRCIVITSTLDLEMAGFDYIMRPGVTPTTNALKLLEMVGLRSPSWVQERFELKSKRIIGYRITIGTVQSNADASILQAMPASK